MAKILIVSHYTPSLINFRGELIRSLVNRGHEIIASGPEEGFERELGALGARFVPIPLERAGINPLKDLITFKEIFNLVASLKPEVVFSYAIKPVIYASIAAGLKKVPRIYSLITGLGYLFGDSNVAQRLLLKSVLPLYRLALKYNSVVFFQNKDDFSLFKTLGLLSPHTTGIVVDGSGVDLERFYFVPPVVNPPSFLLVARLIKDKGIPEYVEAARIVKKKYPEAVFRLLGPFDSNPHAISQNTVTRWVEEGVIEYLGETKDVRPFIASSSVFVLPSMYREGVPRSVLEAMAMGRPVITTDVPGCRETVIPGVNGFLIPPGDITALSKAMEFFILNPEKISLMGIESRKIAEARFDVHKVNKVMIEAMGL